MKYLRLLTITAFIFLALAACGQKDSQEGSLKSDSSPPGKKETNEISVVFNAEEQFNPGAFKLEKTLAYISGMRYNNNSTAKLLNVVFSNYETNIGLFSVEMPEEPGQIVIIVSFKTENLEIPLDQQMDEYAKIKVATGTYEPTWMGEGQGFQVVYFVGGQSDGPAISAQGASGTAILTTSTADKVVGSINFTSPNGSTIKGSFNVKIEKDLWLE